MMKGYFSGAAYADLDNAGNLDVVINCLNAPAVVLKNNAPRKNQLSISLKGDRMNTFGIGAKVWLFTGGTMQYQQKMLTPGFISSSGPQLHFWLHSLNHTHSLLILWP